MQKNNKPSRRARKLQRLKKGDVKQISLDPDFYPTDDEVVFEVVENPVSFTDSDEIEFEALFFECQRRGILKKLDDGEKKKERNTRNEFSA